MAALLMAAGGAMMLPQLGEKGFWLDEALSLARARLDFPSLWREIVTSQANMGLYYVLLHFWVSLGTTEAVVRGLSVVFAVLTIPVVFALGTRMFGQRAGLTAGLLLICNAYFVRYAQEARGYSLALLLVSVSSYCFVRSLERPTRAVWAAHVVTSVLAVYAHFFCALVLAAQAAFLLARRPAVPWRWTVSGWVAIGAGVMPLALFVVYRDAGQIDWVPAPRPVDLLGLFRTLAGNGVGLVSAAYAMACAAAVWTIFAGRSAAGDRMRSMGLAIAWLVVPIAVAFGVSLVKPVFQPRFLIVCLPALVIIAGAGVASIASRRWFAAAAVTLVLLSAHAVRAWRLEPESQFWRRATSYVMSEAQPGDAVVFYVYYGRIPFEYYVERLGLTKAGVDILELASEAWIAGNRQPEPSQAVLDALADRHGRVWLVRLQDSSPPGHPLGRFEQRQRIQESLSRHLTAVRHASFPGGIGVDLYERTNK